MTDEIVYMSGKWAHVTWDLDAVADGTFTLLEDVTS